MDTRACNPILTLFQSHLQTFIMMTLKYSQNITTLQWFNPLINSSLKFQDVNITWNMLYFILFQVVRWLWLPYHSKK